MSNNSIIFLKTAYEKFNYDPITKRTNLLNYHAEKALDCLFIRPFKPEETWLRGSDNLNSKFLEFGVIGGFLEKNTSSYKDVSDAVKSKYKGLFEKYYGATNENDESNYILEIYEIFKDEYIEDLNVMQRSTLKDLHDFMTLMYYDIRGSVPTNEYFETKDGKARAGKDFTEKCKPLTLLLNLLYLAERDGIQATACLRYVKYLVKFHFDRIEEIVFKLHPKLQLFFPVDPKEAELYSKEVNIEDTKVEKVTHHWDKDMIKSFNFFINGEEPWLGALIKKNYAYLLAISKYIIDDNKLRKEIASENKLADYLVKDFPKIDKNLIFGGLLEDSEEEQLLFKKVTTQYPANVYADIIKQLHKNFEKVIYNLKFKVLPINANSYNTSIAKLRSEFNEMNEMFLKPLNKAQENLRHKLKDNIEMTENKKVNLKQKLRVTEIVIEEINKLINLKSKLEDQG